MSSYLVSQDPTRFSNTHEAYLNYVEEIVQKTANALKTQKEAGVELHLVFQETIEHFASARKSWAEKNKHDSFEKFGKPRRNHAGNVSITPFEGPYDEYKVKLVEKVKSYLPHQRYEKKDYLELISTVTKFRREHAASLKTSDGIIQTKESCPIDYNNILRLQVLKNMSPVEGKPIYWLEGMICTTRFYVWEEEQVKVALLHQDNLDIDASLEKLQEIFSKILSMPSGELETLQELLAEFIYIYSHAMPFFRGSAAIGEWLEMALYLFHGYHASYKKDLNVNLEALISPQDEFIAAYPEMITLVSIEA